MMRRFFRIGLRLGLLAGVVVAVLKMVRSRRARTESWPPAPPASWPPIQESSVAPDPSSQVVASGPAPVVTRSPVAPEAPPTPEPAAPAPIWVEPEEGVCPPTHPVKAKLSSMLFHLPGMAAYNRVHPDRCYADEASAAKDGLTKAKR